MPSFAARIHVLLARDVPYGVVIRRGPAKQVATIGWNRESDTFTLGQWLKGRIYERRSDLSPNGKHLIYFAMNGKWESEAKGSWTAVSRAPYLKAIGLWPKGDCWQGGGLFLDGKRYCINGWHCSQQPLLNPHGFKCEPEWRFTGGVGAECLGVYFPRLLRDGWQLTAAPDDSSDASMSTWVFDKPAPHGWTLRKHAVATLNRPPGKGCYYDQHVLLHKSSGNRIDGTNWEWADLDGRRLIWSEAGKLFAGRLSQAGLVEPRELYDFNNMKFEAKAAPY